MRKIAFYVLFVLERFVLPQMETTMYGIHVDVFMFRCVHRFFVMFLCLCLC